MKLNEIVSATGNGIGDLSQNAFSDPNQDRLQKASPARRRRPVITLRHINKLKKMVAAKREEFNARQKLMNIMYSLPEEGEGGV